MKKRNKFPLPFMEKLAELSRPYGVEITEKDGLWECRW